jgi:transcriptional regulator with XRE-family HTH domain
MVLSAYNIRAISLGVGRLPTGKQLAAARVLAGLGQRQLAKLAKLDTSTVNRMERSGDSTVRGHAPNVERVLLALERKGVEIATDGSIRSIAKKR